MSLSKRQKDEKHEHFFGEATQRCACGCVRISRDELRKRLAAWNEHYEKCQDTESAKSFWLCLDAWRQGDFGAVKWFAGEATQRRAAGNYLPKPAFPDPRAQRWETLDENFVALRPYEA